ncbi:hypothetical protein BpHYR1_001652 [Brachionus plicatilis]|uniref:Uncharacterized protein n=1 Tax=Brachionus plicatilis TaxID=10195 RepID=A0A3M7SXT2_BRAPC|nr:hypothetical protein BpHYR1_001652 [Brachionus plicatilis]
MNLFVGKGCECSLLQNGHFSSKLAHPAHIELPQGRTLGTLDLQSYSDRHFEQLGDFVIFLILILIEKINLIYTPVDCINFYLCFFLFLTNRNANDQTSHHLFELQIIKD